MIVIYARTQEAADREQFSNHQLVLSGCPYSWISSGTSYTSNRWSVGAAVQKVTCRCGYDPGYGDPPHCNSGIQYRLVQTHITRLFIPGEKPAHKPPTSRHHNPPNQTQAAQSTTCHPTKTPKTCQSRNP